MQTVLFYLPALPWGWATAWASPAASVWTLWLSGEQWAQLCIRLMDGLPAVLMAIAALVTALKARREAREAAQTAANVAGIAAKENA